MRRFSLIVSAGLVFSLPTAALAGASETPWTLEQMLVRMADDSEQHAALASHFRSKAALARGEAEREVQRGRSALYTHGNAGMQRFLQARRAASAERLIASAESYDAQARLHEDAAERLADEPRSHDEQARVIR